MSELYTPDDLLRKVDGIRIDVKGVLRTVRPIEYAEEIIKKWRKQYGDEFKMIDAPENYLDRQAWKALLRKTLKDVDDVKEQISHISHIVALKCKQHAEKAKTLGDDTEEYKKECEDANWFWDWFQKYFRYEAIMEEIVYELELQADYPPEWYSV